MKIKVVKEIECCGECPFLIYGNGKGSDFCSYKLPRTSGYAILESKSHAGFPEKCPLLKGKILKEYKKRIVLESKLDKLWKIK